jgi:hypothetical protein
LATRIQRRQEYPSDRNPAATRMQWQHFSRLTSRAQGRELSQDLCCPNGYRRHGQIILVFSSVDLGDKTSRGAARVNISDIPARCLTSVISPFWLSIVVLSCESSSVSFSLQPSDGGYLCLGYTKTLGSDMGELEGRESWAGDS